jgi:hypothetical protein
MAGHLHLQLRHCASAIVADSNFCYGQMLLSRDTPVIGWLASGGLARSAALVNHSECKDLGSF